MHVCALVIGATALLLPHRPSRTVRRRATDDNFEVVGSQTVSLKSQFERALVLQRAGDLDGALDEYKAFIDAARVHEVPPAAYAEVRGNVGARLLNRGDLAEAIEEVRELVKKLQEEVAALKRAS